METVVLMLVFIAIGCVGFLVMKKLDAGLEEIRNQSQNALEHREDVIKIACENPIMLSSVATVLDSSSEEFKATSFYFYTGSRTDIQKMLKNKSVDIILLMDEMDRGIYQEKISSFVPSSLSESATGLPVAPTENVQKAMYVFWDENCITPKHRELISNI